MRSLRPPAQCLTSLVSKLIPWLLLAAYGSGGPAAAQGDPVPPFAQGFVAHVESFGGKESALVAATEATVYERALCSTCHDATGTGVKPDFPNIGGQQPLYIIRQLQSFQDKKRKNVTMHSFAKNLSEQQIYNLAIYFPSLSPAPNTLFVETVEPQQLEHGRALFLKRCQHCHGEDARGQGIHPRLGGQKPEYLEDNLKSFRSRSNARKHFGMSSITAELSDEEISALVSYLASLTY